MCGKRHGRLVHCCVSILQGGNEGVLYEFVDPPLANRSLLALISNKHAMTIDTLVSGERAKGAGVEVTCFSSFVVGSGGLHTSEQRIEALPFR